MCDMLFVVCLHITVFHHKANCVFHSRSAVPDILMPLHLLSYIFSRTLQVYCRVWLLS